MISEIRMGRISNDSNKKVSMLYRKYNITDRNMLQSIDEELKQKVQCKAQRIRRYEKRNNFFIQNRNFKENTKKFYRDISKKHSDVLNPPNKEDLEQFWKPIWENEKSYNEEAEWINRQSKILDEVIQPQEWGEISVDEISHQIRKSANWKSPGLDGIPNFWLKQLVSLHDDLAVALTGVINESDAIPGWLTEGITYLLTKN